MPSPKVRGDYDQLQQIAKAFGQEADRTRNVLQRLKQSQNTLQGGDWVGKGATAFYAEMNGAVMPSMQRLANALQQAQSTTDRMSQIMRQAEQDAAGCFRDNSGSGGASSGGAEGGESGSGGSGSGSGSSGSGSEGSGSSSSSNQGQRNKIFPGLEAIAKKGLEWLAKKVAPELLEKIGTKLATKVGISAFKNFPVVGALVSIGFNAYKYWGADPDGSFDWSRFTIETTKDIALMAIGTVTAEFGGPIITAGVDILFGDKIVDGIDNAYHKFVRPLFGG